MSSTSRRAALQGLGLAGLLDAFLGEGATTGVQYEIERNSTRLSVGYAIARRNRAEQSTDLCKAELFIKDRDSAQSAGHFYTDVSFRQARRP